MFSFEADVISFSRADMFVYITVATEDLGIYRLLVIRIVVSLPHLSLNLNFSPPPKRNLKPKIFQQGYFILKVDTFY